MAISREGTLLGGGFFVTRSYALTATVCLPGLRPGDPVDLYTAHGLPLKALVFEVAEDAGLALIAVLPHPRADYATPQADHAVKGDVWRAPYRPGPTSVLLSGTVDEVTHDRRDGAGRAVSVIELASEQEPCEYGGYAGGPVERRTEGHEPAVVGIVLDPGLARRLREGAENSLAASAISSAVEMFEGLSAQSLMGLLTTGLDVRSPIAETPPQASPEVTQAMATARYVLREFKDMADEGLVDPRDVTPYQIRMLDEVVRAASGEEVRD
ncbi:hypothetical protein ACOT81_45230 [Streptomyces sp. WI04-05B]|uniref:hypothetical protein n=1 Tax=Streptomyces TaxID=1883 RepID=UPI0029A6DBE6|nr:MULTISPECIES: hypothetical protein [unclassified Streptomyces]MDX2543461.1 hypothetical protein [Streptomyces sp. WI04-05B]MDX2589130.1 hypothetical protein [Streptomyces sp. WI04-05A]